MLNKETISSSIFSFMKNQQNNVQDDPEKALKEFSDKLSEVIVDAIKSADILIQPGVINVLTSSPGTPSANVVPIKILKSLS